MRKTIVFFVIVCMLCCTLQFPISANDGDVLISCDADGKTEVTNIGEDANGLITVSFNKDMDLSTLIKDNIVLSNEDDSAVDYEINVVDSKTVTIDKMYLSNLKADNSAEAWGTVLASQNFKITVSGVKASGSETAEPAKTFSFSTAEIVAPVPYVKGKLIRNVSAGLNIEARYGFADATVTAGNGTDGNKGTCIWVNDGNDDSSNTEKNDLVARYDLGNEYDICGVALRNFAGYADYRNISVGGSNNSDLDKITDDASGFEKYFETNANFGDNVNRDRVFNAFFTQGQKSAKYIYLAHNRGNVNTTRFSEIYVFAYVGDYVSETVPADNATNISNIGENTVENIEINFSEDMDEVTLNPTNITIEDDEGNEVEYIEYSASTQKYTVPLSVLEKNRRYTVKIGCDVKKLSGESGKEVSFSFSTGYIKKSETDIENMIFSTVPSDNTVDFTDESGMEITFTDGIYSDFLNDNTVKLMRSDDNGSTYAPVSCSDAQYDGSNKKYIIPVENLVSYRKYKLEISGLLSEKDVYGTGTKTVLFETGMIPGTKENFISSTYPSDGARGVTNIGANESGYIEIIFNHDMDVSTLNPDNIILKNADGNAVTYEASVVNKRKYTIDKKYLSNMPLSQTNTSGIVSAGSHFSIEIKNVKSVDGIGQEDFSFGFDTAEIVAPVSYVYGRKIVDISEGLPITTVYPSVLTSSAATDRNDSTFITAQDSTTEKSDITYEYTFKLPLGKKYDIAGVALKNYSKYSFRGITVGASKSGRELEKVSGEDYSEYMYVNNNYNTDGANIYNAFFEKGENSTDCIYGGHLHTSTNNAMFSEIYVFAFVPEIVEYTAPSYGATGVSNIGDSAMDDMKIKFYDTMKEDTVTSENIIISPELTGLPDKNYYTYDANSNVYSVPIRYFRPNTEYTVTVTDRVKKSDGTGNTYEFYFTTGDIKRGIKPGCRETEALNAFKTANDNAQFKTAWDTYAEEVYWLEDYEELKQYSGVIGNTFAMIRNSCYSADDEFTLRSGVFECIRYALSIYSMQELQSSVAKQITEKYGLPLSSFYDFPDDFDALYSIFVRAKSDFSKDSFDSVIKKIYGYANFQDGTQKRKYSDLAGNMKNHHDILGIDLSYASDKNVSIEAVSKKMNAENAYAYYSDFSDGTNWFTKIVDEIAGKSSMGNISDKKGGSGGGSGGLYTTASVPSVTPIPDNTKENENILNIFNDISGYDWAAESIERLYDKKIINGKGNGMFAPSDCVTREEFTAMIVRAFDITCENKNEKSFSDIEEGKWYENYIKIAASCGIVSGMPDGNFGIGNMITRQDMAVILSNLLKNNNISVVAEKPDFYDFNEVDSYAEIAVMTLSKLKIINGFEDNTYRPHGNMTRAEAAVVINRILTYLKGGK